MATLVVALFTLPALAQYSRDSGASQKIDEAVNNHYLMMELDKAESTLKGVVQSCEDKCSPGMVAKAWMYIGIVRGSGKNDLSGASEAFATAQSIDPKVQLDRDLASPETQATFDSLAGGGSAAPAAATATPPPPVAPGGVPGDMSCTLESGTTIATRMPIPLSCTSDADAESAVLKFKEYGSKDWKKVDLKKSGDAFEGAIPCDVTSRSGPLEWFVGAKNAAGEYVDQYGSKKEPATFNISDTGQADLAYSDGTAAVRCTDASDCPPDFPGCGGAAVTGGGECGNLEWGAACKESTDCKCGLLCEEGTCNNAPSCSNDEDCSTGFCDAGYCAPQRGGAAGPFKRHWISGSFAADSVSYGGEELCRSDRQADLSTVCVNSTGQVVDDAAAYAVNDGFVISQFRALVGYDYALTDHIQLGGKIGYIIGGNPKQFMPLHLEARFTYQFFSLSQKGLRALAYAGAGLGDMDFRFAPVQSTDQGELTIYKQGGNLFANFGLGIGYAFTPNIAATLNVGAVITFPIMNFGLQPSLNVTYGF